VTEIDTLGCGGGEDRVALDGRDTQPIVRIDMARGVVYTPAGTFLGRVGRPITLKGTRGDETANITFVVDVTARGFPGCDFNGDGFDDLAVADPRETVSGVAGAGAVNIFYGDRPGLQTTGTQLWHQDSSFVLDLAPLPGISEEIEDRAEAYDQFGASLACGDFDADGLSDLAIGVPYEDIGAIADAVNVLYGSRYGLSMERDQFWHQDRASVADNTEPFDLFGGALASGDFNGDGFDDLAIGAPGDSIAGMRGAGAVNVLFGSETGLQARNDQLLGQVATTESGGEEANDEFGRALAVGDFNGDGLHDLAVAAPYEDLSGTPDAGFVHIFYGAIRRGLTSGSGWYQGKRSIPWDASSVSVADTPEAFDLFGRSLSSGDYNEDGMSDLAIGVPGESIGSADGAGAVNILYGNAHRGLWYDGNTFWHQNRTGIDDIPEAYDGFGSTLTSGDFNGDHWEDLAIGVVDESIGSIVNAGGVHVLFGSILGIQAGLFELPGPIGPLCLANCPQFWHQGRLGGSVEANDAFGHALGSGDFNNDGQDDLAIGVKNELTSAGRRAGAVQVLFGDYRSEGLTSLGRQILHQDHPGIGGDVTSPWDQFGASIAGGA
jgi:hypothetical protein